MKSFQKENPDLSRSLQSHFIGSMSEFGILEDSYETFIAKRAKRIAKALNNAMNPKKIEATRTLSRRTVRR